MDSPNEINKNIKKNKITEPQISENDTIDSENDTESTDATEDKTLELTDLKMDTLKIFEMINTINIEIQLLKKVMVKKNKQSDIPNLDSMQENIDKILSIKLDEFSSKIHNRLYDSNGSNNSSNSNNSSKFNNVTYRK